MRGLVKHHAGPGLQLQEVPKPQIAHDQVLIKVKKAAICGTDVSIWKWNEWAQANIRVGMTLGHEFVGTIAEVGSHVQDLKVGQRVTAEGHLYCHKCRACQLGHIHLCAKFQSIGILGHNGAFADFVAVPAQNIFPLPDDISDEVAAILDPFGNSVHATFAIDVSGEDVLITGAGPVGVLATAICKKIGAHRIVVTDVDDARLEMARKFGATETLNVSRESLDPDQCFTAALEMSGAPEALEMIIEAVSPGTEVALLGIIPKDAGINWPKMVFKGITLKGIYGRRIFRTWHKALHLIQAGLDISPMITHSFPLEEYEEAFATMMSGGSGRVLLEIE